MDKMTLDEFKAVVPVTLRKSMTQEVADQVTDLLSDPDMYETYRENLLGFSNILSEGKYKLRNYVDAVKYVSFKMGDRSNYDAFKLAFPQKIVGWQAAGKKDKDIHSLISSYNKSKLVSTIYTQSLIPSCIVNHDTFQKAVNKLADLMMTSPNERIQMESATSLLTHLKMPETKKIELDIGLKEDSVIDMLRAQTEALVAQQRKSLEAGTVNISQIRTQPIYTSTVDAEYTEVENKDG